MEGGGREEEGECQTMGHLQGEMGGRTIIKCVAPGVGNLAAMSKPSSVSDITLLNDGPPFG